MANFSSLPFLYLLAMRPAGDIALASRLSLQYLTCPITNLSPRHLRSRLQAGEYLGAQRCPQKDDGDEQRQRIQLCESRQVRQLRPVVGDMRAEEKRELVQQGRQEMGRGDTRVTHIQPGKLRQHNLRDRPVI